MRVGNLFDGKLLLTFFIQRLETFFIFVTFFNVFYFWGTFFHLWFTTAARPHSLEGTSVKTGWTYDVVWSTEASTPW